MSYDSKMMRLMGGVPGQQVFCYRSADAAGTVTTSGYFDPAVEDYNLSAGDLILAVLGADGAQVPALYAARISEGTVTLGQVAAA